MRGNNSCNAVVAWVVDIHWFLIAYIAHVDFTSGHFQRYNGTNNKGIAIRIKEERMSNFRFPILKIALLYMEMVGRDIKVG